MPTGFADWSQRLNEGNTLYWSKRAWAAGPNDVTKAEITRWMGKGEYDGDSNWRACRTR